MRSNGSSKESSRLPTSLVRKRRKAKTTTARTTMSITEGPSHCDRCGRDAFRHIAIDAGETRFAVVELDVVLVAADVRRVTSNCMKTSSD
jgi:hypothetical protein